MDLFVKGWTECLCDGWAQGQQEGHHPRLGPWKAGASWKNFRKEARPSLGSWFVSTVSLANVLTAVPEIKPGSIAALTKKYKDGDLFKFRAVELTGSVRQLTMLAAAAADDRGASAPQRTQSAKDFWFQAGLEGGSRWQMFAATPALSISWAVLATCCFYYNPLSTALGAFCAWQVGTRFPESTPNQWIHQGLNRVNNGQNIERAALYFYIYSCLKVLAPMQQFYGLSLVSIAASFATGCATGCYFASDIVLGGEESSLPQEID